MFGKIVLIILLVGITGLSAWERQSMHTTRCQDAGKSMYRCKKENEEENEYLFTTQLTPLNFKTFNAFSPLQKKNAMDLADNNKMGPNEAVEQVSEE
jgi:hypothetical protein